MIELENEEIRARAGIGNISKTIKEDRPRYCMHDAPIASLTAR